MNKKTKLMREADRLWYDALFSPICEVCGETAIQVHHFYYKGSYGHLRYDQENGVPICQKCHYKIHFKDPKPIEEIIKKKRGTKWYNRLTKKAETRPNSSYKTIKYYQDIISQYEKSPQ